MAPSTPHASEVRRRLASGIEAGIVGGVAMLGLLICASLSDGRVWWEVPNLFGSTFYGPRAFRAGPGMATLSGFALHFVITGTLGGLFGLAFGGIQRRGQLILLGLLTAVGWYNLAYATFWPAVNPWVLLASPRPVTMVSHVLLGACLGYMGKRQRLTAPVQPGAIGPLGPIESSVNLEPAASIGPPGLPAPDGDGAQPAEIALNGVALAGESPAANGQPSAENPSHVANFTEPPAVSSSDALE
jgi:hypothetical protein